MNEPSNFDGGNRRNDTSVSAAGPLTCVHNLYGLRMAQASARGWAMANPERRGLIISRAGYPGLQQHSTVWHGDNHAWWEHLRMAIDNAIGYSLCGLYYSGADVPGFSGSPTADLAVRFFQLGAFLPFYRGHSAYFGKDREPFAFPEPERSRIREAIELRYSLLREWYSAFERAARDGIVPLAPIFDDAGRLVRDQFLLFGKLLVAPVVQRDQAEKLVYLPRGEWYPWGCSHERLSGGRSIVCEVSRWEVPLFVKAGSILVRNTVALRTEATLGGPEAFDIYPDAAGNATGYWYDDDHVSVHPEGVVRFQLRYNKETDEVEREAVLESG